MLFALNLRIHQSQNFETENDTNQMTRINQKTKEVPKKSYFVGLNDIGSFRKARLPQEVRRKVDETQ